MKVTKKEVAHWLELHPQYKKRSLMYIATAEFCGISPEEVEMALVFHRRLQDILPNDAKGRKLEKDWRSEEGMASIVELATKTLTPPGYVRVRGQLMKII